MTIELIEGPSGKMIPGQKIRTVYFKRGNELARAEAYSDEEMYVSHFETCPEASHFSRRWHQS